MEFIRFILSLSPIFWLIFALIVLKMQAHVASIGAFIFSCLIALFLFQMPIPNMVLASIEGATMAQKMSAITKIQRHDVVGWITLEGSMS